MIRLALALALAIGIGYLPYRAYGPDGVARALRLEREHLQLVEDNARLRRENRSLARRIQRLKDDHRAIERVARDELGLVREQDMVFLFE